MTRRILLAIVIGTSFFLGGCATMFHGRTDLEVIAPEHVQIEDANGAPISAYEDYGGTIVHVDPAHTDSLRIRYKDYTTTIALAKNPSGVEIFNLLTFGIGYSIDDLTHWWGTYAPVHVRIDSDASGIHGISATSKNWLGESAGEPDFHALLLFGTGFAIQTGNDVTGAPSPGGLGNIRNFYAAFQAGAGLDFRKQLELFYLVRSEPEYGISPDGSETAEIDASDVCLRWFYQKNLFLQASYGRAYASNAFGTTGTFDPITGEFIPINSVTNFNEIGAALGWAGDISYIALQYFQGLSPFSAGDYSNIRYHAIYIDFGLNFRL